MIWPHLNSFGPDPALIRVMSCSTWIKGKEQEENEDGDGDTLLCFSPLSLCAPAAAGTGKRETLKEKGKDEIGEFRKKGLHTNKKTKPIKKPETVSQ